MRKILFLTIAWLLSFVGAGAQNFRFVELADGTLMLSYRIYVDEHGYTHRLENSYAGDIIIPEIYEDKLVTRIDELTFDKCVYLTSVVIPSTVDTIGSAFNGCTALKKIIIADSEKELKLPGSLGNYWGLFDTYYNHLNSLDEVYVGRNIVTAGGHSAFANEHIKKLTLGDNVTRLENEAFRNCRGLRSVTLGPNLTSIGRQAFYQCDSLPSLVIPDGVNEIGYEAFVYCNALETIHLPASLNRIEGNTFYDCKSLQSIVIPAAVDSIGGSAFYNCNSLVKLTIADSERELKLDGSLGNQWGMFDTYYNHLNSLEEVYVGRNVVTAGGHSAFSNEHIKKLTLGDNVTRLEKEAFRNCRGLRSVTLGPNLTSIGRQAFYQCDSLPSLVIPDGVNEIGYEAFVYCNALETIHLPASLNRIEGNTFYDCKSLQSIVIPAAVDSIGGSAFYNCNSLVKLTIADSDRELKLYGSLGNQWGMFDTYYNHLNSLEEVYVGRNVVTAGGHSAFANEHIKKLTLGDNVTRLEKEAFRNCRGLRSVTLGPNLTSIGRQAFYQCDSLPSLSIPDGVNEIGYEAFVYCNALETIHLPASLNRIEGNTFYDCKSLQSIVIPAAVDSIGGSAFYNCNSLVKLTIADSDRELKLDGSSGNYWGMFDTYYNHLNSLVEVYVGRNLSVTGGHCPFYNENIATLILGGKVTNLYGEDYGYCNPSELHCNAVIPPVCSSPNVFKKIDKQMCNLYVPEASIDAYKEAPVWLEFFNIHSGIENVEMEDELGASSVVEEMERYSLDGRVGGSEHGVNIVRMSDGTVRKVLVK